MCRQVKCKKCNGITWAGCGQHVDQVMRGVPKSAKCSCPPPEQGTGFFGKLFGKG